MIRALLFDCDGVLADNEPIHYRAFQEALRPEGIAISMSDYAAILLGRPDREAAEQVLRWAGKDAGEAAVERVFRAKVAAYGRSLTRGIPAVPGAADLVRKAPPGLLLAIASGGLRSEVDTVLDRLGVKDRFAAVVSSEDCPRGKPDPAPFLLALERLNARDPAPVPPLTAAECLVFEDSEAGITAARVAGMRCVGLTTTRSGDDLRDADFVVQNFRAFDLERMTAFFDRRARG